MEKIKPLENNKEFNKYLVDKFKINTLVVQRQSDCISNLEIKTSMYEATIKKLLSDSLITDKVIKDLHEKLDNLNNFNLSKSNTIRRLQSKNSRQLYQLNSLREVIEDKDKLNKKLKKKIKKVKAK